MSDVVKLNKSILGLTGTIEKFVESMGKIDKINDSATKKVRELTKAQDALGLTLKKNDLVSKRTGNKVNEFGEEITKVGDKMLAFNKRSSILSETIKELNKNNERFNFITSQLSDILTDSAEIGEMEFDIFKFKINSLKTYQKNLIVCK